MGEIVIKKKNTTIDLFNYKPFRSVTKAELSRTLMSDDYVDISVECANTLDLNIGDRVTVEGRTFFLNMLPPAKKIAEDQFSYELRFEGPAFLLRKLKVFNLDSQGNKTTNEFPLTGEINEFLYLLINNANKKDNQWILGNVPSNTETKTLTFNNENCLAVLQRICQEFNVEFDIVEAGGKFTLNIREKIGKTLPFTVEYGMGNGLYDLSRARANDSEVVTVLYAYGSSQNIPVDYRGYSPRLRMPVAVGDYISNQAAIDLFGYVEDVFTPDIKPTFKGKVSGIGSLANGVQEISVSNMDFDLKEKESDGKTTKYLIAGTPAKISVTKGNLAGYDFEINDYDHSSKTFKLKQFADDRGQKFPDNTTVFKFAAGDEFTLIDIIMPEQYIINAEQKLYDETVKEYQKVSQNNVKYTLNVDPLFLQDKGEIGIGDLLPIKDADFGIDKASRIISLKKDLLTDTYTSFDVADSYEISLVKEIVNNIKDLQKEIASQKVINRQSYLDGYRRVEDRFSMYFDADGKMDGSHIKADTIDVGMLSSGSKSRWFQLEEVVFTPNLGSDPNSFRATAGRLVHFGIKTSSGAERIWNLSALTVNNLLNQGYYVYAKCDINGDYGTFIITPDRIVFDSQPNYYHFLIGNLYTAASGGRAFDANYGVSQMNGRMIFAGVISDIQGRPMIDLDKREIIGKVTFTNDSPALNQVQEKIDAVQVGSVNLLDNSAVFAMSANDVGLGTSVLIENESEKFYRATPDNGKRVSLYGIWYTLESNQEYVRGIYVRHSASVAQDVRVFNHNSNVGGEKITTIQPNTWTFIKTNTIIGSGGNTVLILEMFTPNISLDYKKTILVKGNRLVNDWTPSANDINNEITVAKQNATNAQNTANTAVNNAAIANQRLADIANDNKLTPEEKSDTIKEWDIIADEYLKLIPQANTYGVDTNAYTGAKNALSSYLISISYNNLNTTSDINGTEFRQKFRDYYDAKVSLLKAISDAAKSYATGLVNNLQVGSRNLLLESNIQISQPPGVYRIGGYLTSKLLEVGKTYTLMFKSGNGGRESVGAWVNGYQHIGVNEIDGGIKTFTFIVENTGRDLNIIDFYKVPNTDTDRWASVYWAVLVEGNKMGLQSWMAAPEDLEKKITDAQNSANTANQKLTDIASDNRLTPSEKQDTLKEWTVIVNEVPIIKDQAATYGVSYANYEGHYVNLSNYLTNNGLLADLSTTSDIDGATFRLYFKNYYGAKVDLLRNISTASKNYTNSTTEAAKTEMAKDARNKALAASYASGKCLNRDVDFRDTLNGIQVYNNAGNGNVSLVHWIGGAPASQAPTKSTNVLAVEYNGQGADPYNGGFYFGTQTRANAVFVVRIIMKLATGQEISFHSNQAGDSFTFDWTTPIKGTGKWEEYIGILRCGATGAFSSSMFFAFFGASVPLSTYICYASVFDLTDVDRYLEDRIKQNEQQTALAKAQADNALATSNITSQKVSFLSTTINNNVVSTGTLEVGDVVGANAGITGVTDRGRQSVRMYAGAPYANKNTAPFTLQDDGLIKMHHPNGNKGFELGIVDGKLVFNVYDDVGNKIMEMGSAGIIFANYIPDSWSTFYLGKFNSSSYNPYNLNEVSSFANANTKQEMLNNPGNIDDPEQWLVTIPKSDSEWVNYSQYSAGTSYDSNTYKKYEGIYYKGTLQKPQKPNDYTEKLADGWYYYTVSTHVWKQRGNPNMNGRYEYAFTLFRLSQGQLVETLNYELSGIV
ncbi:TPA: DUF1542 domain-containing protein [Elizabethkingia anophelis]|nr:DUF1542 domain-containing protein [Elizabethkingia anophelis]